MDDKKSNRSDTKSAGNYPTSAASVISIADLLRIVKETYRSYGRRADQGSEGCSVADRDRDEESQEQSVQYGGWAEGSGCGKRIGRSPPGEIREGSIIDVFRVHAATQPATQRDRIYGYFAVFLCKI